MLPMLNSQSGPFQPPDAGHRRHLGHAPYTNNALLSGSFSRGSDSLHFNGHPYYSYLPAGTDSSTHAPAASTPGITIDATGRKPPPPSRFAVHAQSVPQSWQWTPAWTRACIAPVSVTASAAVAPSSNNNKRATALRADPRASIVAAPSSSMALPHDTGNDPADNAFTSRPVLPSADPQPSYSASAQIPGTTVVGQTSNPAPTREKKHGCWMCHKSFDRPSTLRKVCAV
jgi:hypothetical protein